MRVVLDRFCHRRLVSFSEAQSLSPDRVLLLLGSPLGCALRFWLGFGVQSFFYFEIICFLELVSLLLSVANQGRPPRGSSWSSPCCRFTFIARSSFIAGFFVASDGSSAIITSDLLGVSGYGLICHAQVRWRVSSPCPSFHSSNLCPAGWVPKHSHPGCKLAEMLRHLVWLASVLQILSLWLHVLFSLCLLRSKALLLRRGVVIGMRAAVVEALHSLVISLTHFFFHGCWMHIALCVLSCRHPALHIQFADLLLAGLAHDRLYFVLNSFKLILQQSIGVFNAAVQMLLKLVAMLPD
ncbi:hypothetical protein Nepgr_021060 [Nepenthes gracilis]|uniref:Uncharacterized protein n=1 Tax=Nepenthes gracilis TaxID=150966 RepID=A0AAD3SYV0_NEPGR|nr:hypothetical protein Nepgr_021060 [Nepenthes gracilis]